MEQKPQGQENCQLGRSEQTTGFPPEKVKNRDSCRVAGIRGDQFI
jgi:hypothetical protein